MIYEDVGQDAPIRQGDIFRSVPRVDISLETLLVVDKDDSMHQTTWRESLDHGAEDEGVAAILPIKPVDAIVVTQDCDCVRSEEILLFQIEPYFNGKPKDAPKNPNGWKRRIFGDMIKTPRLFYLPKSLAHGFPERRAANFRVGISVPRVGLEAMRDQRVARLKAVANEHFRESIAQFFRRYPVNNWYPLDKDEFAAHASGNFTPEEKPKPYPWQE